MNVDLHRALGTLADGGERRTAPTDHLLARVHRRRAARAAATGAVRLGTVAAVAIGAVALNGRTPANDDPPPVGGTESPTALPTFEPPPGTEPVPTGDALNCGSWAPEPLIAEVGGVSLDVEIPDTWREGDIFVLPGQVDATGGAVELTQHSVMVALLSDGTVRASGGAVVNLATEGGGSPSGRLSSPSCYSNRTVSSGSRPASTPPSRRCSTTSATAGPESSR